MNIGYARVSMARQGESLDTQHFFSDIVSGSKWQRHGLRMPWRTSAPATPSL